MHSLVDPLQSGGIVGSFFGLKFKRCCSAFFIVRYKDIYQLGKVDWIESGSKNYCHFEDWLIAKGDLMFVYNYDVNSSIKPVTLKKLPQQTLVLYPDISCE